MNEWDLTMRNFLRICFLSLVFSWPVWISENGFSQPGESQIRSALLEQLNEVPVLQEETEEQRLQGTWIVQSVQRDGVANPAQVGQLPGDVIRIKGDGQRMEFG